MNVTLLEVQGKKDTCIYKDWAGGFGTSFSAGDSVFAKLITLAKKAGITLPITEYGYIAAILKQCGHDVEYKRNEMPEDSDLVIIQSSMVDYKAETWWGAQIKKMTDAKLCYIGPFSSQMPELYSKSADIIIKGEPESAIKRICRGDKLSGVVESAPVKNLDRIPFPDWSEFPVEHYSYFPALKRKPVLPVLASRGCPYRCNYCPYKVQWSYRTRTSKNVVDEIKHITEIYGARGVIFRDPLFTCNHKHAEDIAKGMIKSTIDIEWGCETRLDHLTTPLLKTLHESGLRHIEVGVESYYDEVISAEKRKPIGKDHQEKIVEVCAELGIKLTAFYIIGLPGDTLDKVMKTIEYAKKLNTTVASFAISTPFPGTEFYEKMKDKIYETDWEEFTTYNPTYTHPTLSRKQLLKLKELAFLKYFYSPSYLFKLAREMYR
jgi:anaerobic magnesium-protoporphyrin IX monomethyl ester cyclase